MQIKYVCDYCGNDFSTEEKCRQCEMSHLTDIEKLKYDINIINIKIYAIFVTILFMCMGQKEIVKIIINV